MIVLSSKKDNLRITTEKTLLTTRIRKNICIIHTYMCVYNEYDYICICVYIIMCYLMILNIQVVHNVSQEMLLSWLGLLPL